MKYVLKYEDWLDETGTYVEYFEDLEAMRDRANWLLGANGNGIVPIYHSIEGWRVEDVLKHEPTPHGYGLFFILE